MKKKLIIFLTGILTCCLVLMSCGSGDSKSAQEDLDLDAVKEAVLAADEELPEMLIASSKDENANVYLSSIVDEDTVPMSDVQSFLICYSSEGLADEIVVLQMKDEDAAKKAATALKDHLESRQKLFAEYKASESDKLDNATIDIDGTVVTLAICSNPSAVVTACHGAVAK